MFEALAAAGREFAERADRAQHDATDAARRCYDTMRALYDSPRRARIAYNADARTFVVTGDGAPQRYRGITAELDRVLLGGDTARCFSVERRYWARSKSVTAASRAATACKGAVDSGATYGSAHGLLVHRHVEEIVRRLKRHGALDDADARRRFDACALQVVATLEAEALFPVFSEYALYDDATRTASAVDLICIDTRRMRIVLVELKSGYSDARYTEGFPALADTQLPDVPYMQAPFAAVPASPYYRHSFQLLRYSLILERFYGVAVDQQDMLIARISPLTARCHLYDVPPWMRTPAMRDAVYAEFLKHAQ